MYGDIWIIWIVVSISLTLAFMLLTFALVQRRERKKLKTKEDSALKGVSTGIGARLHVASPDSKWRWVCRPAGFAINGGIARIEVVDRFGKVNFMDVCLSSTGYMALHVISVVELLTVASTQTTDSNPVVTNLASADIDVDDDEISAIVEETHMLPIPPKTVKPNDEESTDKWFNIVLKDSLTALIDDLYAKGDVCLYLGQDGKAYIEEGGNTAIVYEFGEMPDMSLWGYVTTKLGEIGLFAESQEEGHIFISWA